MLRALHIENIAIIEKADIDFSAGMNVLTGETGAGKSIVVDALGAALGGRISHDLVRSGADSALVTAVFSGDNAAEWCAENGIDPEEDELFLTRRITADGRSSCRVNGVPVPLSSLRELGKRLLNIHGQHNGQRLLDEHFHLDYLDGFAGTAPDISAYAALYGEYSALCREKEALELSEGEKARRMDMLRYQIGEIENAHVIPGEVEEKSQRRELLKNSARLIGALDQAYVDLYGDDYGGGALSQIGDAENALSSIARYGEEPAALSKKLEDLRYAAEDIVEELGEFRRSLNFSPDELDEIETRLDLLRRLFRKYGGDENELIAFLEKARKELEDMESSEERLAGLSVEISERRRLLEKAAAALSEKRRSAATILREKIESELALLSMSGVRFEIELQPTAELTKSGADVVSFLISANAGERPGRLSRIASGGELARIMLAMINVLVESDGIPALVFDEIDTGVSGVAAQRVAEKLSDLAYGKQVICITHLPQIAAMADRQFSISKSSHDGRTYTEVRRLDPEGRAQEIARLHGGDHVTALTLKSADEQIKAADEYKQRRRR